MFNKLKILTKMKIKNMKLMLLSLFGLISVNAMAGDIGPAANATITRANLAYKVTKAATDAGAAGEVTFLGMVATPDKKDADGPIANQPDGTITIPATVWTLYGDKGNKVNYNVTAIDPEWASYGDGANVKAKLKKLVSEVVEIGADKKVTSNLIATDFASLQEVVLPAGQTVLAASAFSGCAKLATINLANVANYGENAMKGTAITSVDLTNAITIGASAFQSCVYVSTLSIPATVTTIGEDAFANMYYQKDEKTVYGLQTLTFDAYADATKGFKTFPDAFSGDELLNSITLKSAIATGFDGDFTDAAKLATLTLECPKVTTIAGIFAAAPFVTVDIEKTGLTKTDLDFSKAHQSLTTIKLPATLATLGTEFQDCVALTAIDLSATKVTVIPASAFKITRAEKDAKGNAIAPALASVKLNAKTTEIGEAAFQRQTALATVEGLNQGELLSIGTAAFNKVKFAEVDLSAAAKLTTIPSLAFANNNALTSIKLNKAITYLGVGAFAYDKNVASINLGDLEKLTTLEPIFHEGVVGSDEGAKEVAIALKSVTLPAKLTYINPGALQLLDITEIEIPSSVKYLGDCALQGCIYLKKFTWNTESYVYETNNYNWFKGCDKMEEAYFLNSNVSGWLNDDIFFGNDKSRLTVYVTGETYNVLIAAQNWNENSVYSTLAGIGESEYDMTADGKNVKSTDGYYYRTLAPGSIQTYTDYETGEDRLGIFGSAIWISESEAEVFGAVIEGANVVLKPAEVENGYYKVVPGEAAVIRSTNETIAIELKNLDANYQSTVKENDLMIAMEDTPASRLKFQYKLGVKDGQVKFWRVTSGTIKKGVAYLWTENIFADREFLDMIVEGEATAIKGIQTKAENDGAIYNLQGVRVKTAQKGLYIQNGKKFIVK